MEEIKKSVVESLDGFEIELFPYLPYLLQDLWEIGADPSSMLSLIKKNIKNKNLKILDLGCGKGAISINIAKELKCKVKGIDAMPEFIESANKYAKEYQVQEFCEFEVGDIRTQINQLKGFDIVILGAIGPILGNLQTSLETLRKVLNQGGYILLDDGYIDDELQTTYDRCLRKSDFYKHIKTAGYEIIQEMIMSKEKIEDSDEFIYGSIEKRANELIHQHPGKEVLFRSYLKNQAFENDVLANVLITGTWLLRLKTYK